jgi:hypothetical protein
MGNEGETTSNARSKSKGRGTSEVHRPQHSQQAAASAHPQAGSDRAPPHPREGLNKQTNKNKQAKQNKQNKFYIKQAPSCNDKAPCLEAVLEKRFFVIMAIA